MARTKLGTAYLTPEDRGLKALVDYIRSKTGRGLMKQEDLAAKIGISPSALSQRMNHKAKFTHDDIMAICRVFRTTDDEILSFYGRGPKKDKMSA